MGRDEWIDAALSALAQGGTKAVAVEPLARRLGVTKGSFYWHFATRDELVAAAIDRWEHERSALPPLPGDDPRAALEALADRAVDLAAGESISARLALETADERIAAALARVTERRLRVLAGLYRDLGFSRADARAQAKLAYATLLGLQRLHAEGAFGPRDVAGVRRAFRRVLLP